MALKKMIAIIVSYIYGKTEVRSKNFGNDMEAAKDAYNQCVKLDHPCRLAVSIDGVEVQLLAHNWTRSDFKKEADHIWRTNISNRLVAAKLTKPQIDMVMTMSSDDIRNAVSCDDVEKLCELKGIAEKSAYKIIDALKPLCIAQKAPLGKSREFTRVTLNNGQGDNKYIIDTIRKTVSPFEAMAMTLGGKDAVIHVVSRIVDDDKNNLEQQLWAEQLMDYWLDKVENGIIVNGIRYRVIGHGTNSAKKCQLIAVKEEIYDAMWKWSNKDCNRNWRNTVAKEIAYKIGLHAVYHHPINIPFQPEDFCILPTVETEYVCDTTKLFLDGHAEDIDNNPVMMKRSDGEFMIHVSAKMHGVLFRRMIERGDDPEEAERILNEFIMDKTYSSYRADGAALKGLGVKAFNFHARARRIGKPYTPDGRPWDDIIFAVDETVIKTPIGDDKAYKTFEDWCNAVRDELCLGVLVRTHEKEKKDVSYQVLQSICEASQEMVEDMAASTIDRMNKMHTIEGAAKLLGREWGGILRQFPALANVRAFKERIEHEIEDVTNTAFSGKLIKECYYAFVVSDPVFVFDRWNGVESEGMLKAGEIHVPTMKYGKKVMWRSPVMHPNSVRIVNNVPIPEEFKECFEDEFAIILNAIDDIAQAMDMDFDGDHANVSENEAILKAVEATLEKWNRLIIWETPKPDKIVIGEDDIKQYFQNLVHMNELGLTVFGLNALLNGLKTEKDPIDGYWYTKRVPVSARGVDFKKFTANVLVDASKHGSAEITEPEESSQCESMLQPWAKTYQDAVRNKMFWYVKFEGAPKYFERLTEAQQYYNAIRYETVWFVKLADGFHCFPSVKMLEAFCSEKGVPCERKNTKVDRFDAEACEKASKSCGYDIKPLKKNELLEPVNYLDELADPKRLPSLHRYKTLNMYFAHLAENARRDTKIDDVPEEAFDYHVLMFNPEGSRRGLSRLIRKGEMELVVLNGDKCHPDEGLFNALARMYDRDKAEYLCDDSIKDKNIGTFNMLWRGNALATIREFAEANGSTLEDAYDVITWQMFAFCDKDYATMDGKMDFVRDKLWSAYMIVFGGIAAKRIRDLYGDTEE